MNRPSESPSPLNGLRANASAKDNAIWAGVRGETVRLAPVSEDRFREGSFSLLAPTWV